MPDWDYLANLKKTKSGFKRNQFSRTQLLIFLLSFSLIGILIYTSFASPNPNLQGDLNNDNKVDGLDLSFLAANYKTHTTSADINGDGIVDIADLALLLENYGKSYSGGGGVSEPFLASSAINQPIPSNPTISPDSLSMTTNNPSFYLPSTSNYKEWFGPRARVMYAKVPSFSGVPTIQVYVNYTDAHGYGCATTPTTVPWPASFTNALTGSDPNFAATSDKISYIASEANGDVWEGYRVTPPGMASKDISCSSSRWNAVRMDYWPQEETSDVGYGHGKGASASDILVGAGLMVPSDFTDTSQGSYIHHALRMNVEADPTSSSPHPRFVLPADAPVGNGDFSDTRGIPGGSRIQLDPSIDIYTWPSVVAKSEPWRSSLEKILRTLQIYGAVYVDGSGCAGCGGIESAEPASVAPYVFPWEQAGYGWSYGDGIPYDLMSHFRIIDWTKWTGA